MKEFLSGAALAALTAFCAHRLQAGGSGAILAVNLALFLMAASVGGARLLADRVSGGRGGVLASLGMCLLLTGAWVFLLPSLWWLLALLLAGIIVICFSLAMWRQFLPRRLSLLVTGCGALAALALYSMGLPALMGVGWLTLLLVACGAAALNAPVSRETSVPPVRWKLFQNASFYLLAVALGAVLAALTRGYTHGAHSPLYGLSDAAMVFSAGIVLGRLFSLHTLLDRRAASFFGALGLLFLAAVLHSGYLLYPDLVMSEAGAAQLPDALDGASRTFPFLAAALVAGMLAAGVPWSGEGDSAAPFLLSMSAGAAIGAISILPGYYRLAGLLAALPAAWTVGWLLRDADFRRLLDSRVLAWGGAAVAGAAVLWTATVDPWMGYWPSRSAASRYVQPSERRMNGSPTGDEDVTPDRFRVTGSGGGASGPRLALAWKEQQVRTWGGNVVSSSRGLDQSAVRLMVALGMAFGGEVQRVGLVRPTLSQTARGASLLAPGAELLALSPRNISPSGAGYDAVLVGPGAMTGRLNSLHVLSIERLRRLRASLSADGVAAIWLPTRAVSPAGLCRVLATIDGAFGGFRLFASGDELVVLAGSDKSISWSSLEAFFEDEKAENYLVDGDLWTPRQLLLGYVADADEMGGILEGKSPLSLSAPARPPRLARDLGAPTRAPAAATVLQYRMMGPDRLSGLVVGEQTGRELGRSRRLYRKLTDHLLTRVGQVGMASRFEFAEFLNGPYLDLALFSGPRTGTRSLRQARACYEFGLHKTALTMLEGLEKSGGQRFGVHYWTGRNLQAQGKPAEAIDAYRRALKLRGDSVETLKRLVALHLRAGDAEPAADRMNDILDLQPRNVDAMLFLANLHGTGEQYGKAIRLVRRALRVEPGNPRARSMLTFYRRMRGSFGGREEKQHN